MWKNIVEKLRALATRERLKKLSWYAALAALLTVLGLASTAYRNGRMLSYDRSAPAGLSEEMAIVADAPLATVTPQPLFALPSPTPVPTPEPVVFAWPVEGEIIGEYAPDGLVWSETLGQWQSHAGIDIAAAAGEAVAACAEGTVREAWEDPLWGDVIEIEHRQGYVSTYANLSTLNMVSPGDEVAAGQIIGAVGNTAACESGMPWHLHFALTRDGAPVDCQKLLR